MPYKKIDKTQRFLCVAPQKTQLAHFWKAKQRN